MKNGQTVFKIRRDQPGFVNVAFSPDMKTVAISSIFDVSLYDFQTRTLLATLRGPRGSQLTAAHPDVSSLSFSPDGRTLAVGTYQNSILLWKLDRLRTRLDELGLDWRDTSTPRL